MGDTSDRLVVSIMSGAKTGHFWVGVSLSGHMLTSESHLTFQCGFNSASPVSFQPLSFSLGLLRCPVLQAVNLVLCLGSVQKAIARLPSPVCIIQSSVFPSVILREPFLKHQPCSCSWDLIALHGFKYKQSSSLFAWIIDQPSTA